MTKFNYHAKDSKGKVIHSSIEASSKDEAIERISEMGYYPLHLEDSQALHRKGIRHAGFFKKKSLRNSVTSFSNDLARLLKSGIPILKAVRIISDQTKEPYFKAILDNILVDVRDGKSLSSALSAYPTVFNHFFVSMVQVGEENGTLPEALFRVAEYRRKQAVIVGKVKSALAYPSLVAVIGFFTVIFIISYVMPKLTGLIMSINSELPLVTKFLINTVQFWQDNSLPVSFACVLGYFVIRAVSLNTAGHSAIDAFKLKMPFFGDLILKSEIVKFAHTLGISLDSGLQMLRSLRLSVFVLSNLQIKKEVENYYDKIRAGDSLGNLMKRSKYFPPSIGNMISVGEESGNLKDVLEQVTQDYERSLEENIQVVTSLIEPVLIILIGLVIGFIVLALLMPIFQMDIIAK